MRRRLRFLRRARELAYRDLGGLVFEMHRLGRRREDLLQGKLLTLGHIDTELRELETALAESRSITLLREAGVTACPRCAAIHGSEDRFCPACGFSMGRRAELPVASAPAAPVPAAPPPAAPASPAAPSSEWTPAPAASQAPIGSPPPENPPPASPAPADPGQTTQILEPPTQIIRPGRTGSPPGADPPDPPASRP
jgi:hypothetical protein